MLLQFIIHLYFGKNFQSRGQAIYISVAFGLGGGVVVYSWGSWQTRKGG